MRVRFTVLKLKMFSMMISDKLLKKLADLRPSKTSRFVLKHLCEMGQVLDHKFSFSDFDRPIIL